MCWRSRKTKSNFQFNSVPPEPPLNKDAVEVVFNEDKIRYYEIYFDGEAYRFSVFKLDYEDMADMGLGLHYYWRPIDDRYAHFFDTKEKAEQEAKIVMESYSGGGSV